MRERKGRRLKGLNKGGEEEETRREVRRGSGNERKGVKMN